MTTTTGDGTVILKQDRLGRVRTPRDKQEAILEEYDRSGMSAAEFAKFAGIKYQTFATWIQKRRRRMSVKVQAAGDQPVRWVEAVVGGEQEATGGCLILQLGSGVRMEVGSLQGAQYAAEVLRQLGAGKC